MQVPSGLINLVFEGTGVPGEIAISGFPVDYDNGYVDGRVTLSGVTGDISILAADGNFKSIVLDNIYCAGSILIGAAYGTTFITVGTRGVVSCRGDLSIVTASDSDHINLGGNRHSVFVGGKLFIAGSTAKDVISVYGASATDISIDGGYGADEISVENVTAVKRLAVTGGNHYDSLPDPVDDISVLRSSALEGAVVETDNNGYLFVDTFYTRGILRVGSTFGGGPTEGNLAVTVVRSIAGQLIAYGHGTHPETPSPFGQLGHDQFNISGNVLGHMGAQFAGTALWMDTEAGNDLVLVTNNVMASLSLSLAEDDDSITFADNRVDTGAYFDGGDGTDYINVLNNRVGGWAIVNFP